MKNIVKRTKDEERLLYKYVIDELAKIGIDIGRIDNLWGILGRKGLEDKRELLIDMFFEWLDKFDEPNMLEFIVRAMATKYARPFSGPRLIEFYHQIPNEFNSLKWAIGNSIEAAITPDLIDPIVEILKDKKNGTSRNMFILGLGKIRARKSIPLLISLLDQDGVQYCTISALKQMNVLEAKEKIEKFLNHENSYLRKAAKKALEKFEKMRLKEIEKERKKNIRLVHSKE